MAILKDLIVHGSSRFLNKIYASEIQTPLIEAETGIFKKLKADDATVVGLLDVKGQLHTNNWSNSNIATIDGSFYITPTIGSDSGTVTITATSLNFSGTNYAVTSLYLGDNSSITWPQYSKVLVTGQILSNGEWIPLGTLLGQLSAQAAAASISINSIKDNKNQTSNVLATLVNEGTTSSSYRNLKVSLYQRASSSTAFYPLGIYITATGTNGRTFLDIYGGVEALSNSNNYGGLAEPNVRIGNLQGLPNVGGQNPSGWGIYTDNGYFKGIIAADRGYIGSGSKYWVIANEEDLSNVENSRSFIYNGTDSINSSTPGIYLGTDGIRNYEDSTHFVTIKDGVITAQGVNLSGTINASSGYIAGWRIASSYLSSTTATAPGENILILSPKGTSSSYTIASQAKTGWMITAGTSFGVNKDGGVYASKGKIGGWEIGSNYLLTGTWGTGESALLSTGSGSYKEIGGSGSINNWVFTAGANFGVTKSGALYASSANISGKVVATEGSIGGINIVNGNLDVSSISIGNLSGANDYAQKTDVAQAIDNIEVGGRNLVWNSNFHLPINGTWSNWGSPTTREIVTINGENWMHIVTTANAFQGYQQSQTNRNGFGQIQAGDKIIFSYDAYSKIEGQKGCIGVHWRDSNNTNISQNWASFDLTTTKKRYITPVFTVPTNAVGFNIMIGQNIATAQEIWITNIKGEKGNKATAWTPAPEDIENEINNAEETATSYITYIDSTEGIKIHNILDQVNYLKLNSSAISMYRNDIETLNISNNEIRIGKFSDKNVFIDNDSVDIRKGTTTLASFTGDNTKFYDPIYKKELATFGVSGAIIGANSEQRFIIEKDEIKSINDSGATVFSVNSTNGTVVTEAQVASGGESYYLSGKTVVFDTVGTGFTTNTTFYTKKLTAIIEIRNSAKPLTNVKVNSVTATSTLVDSYSGYWYSSTHSINLSPFTFTYGTSKRETYQITASFVNDYGDSYNLTAQASINYDGIVTLTVQLLTGECVRTSGNNEDIATMDLIRSKIVYGEIYQSSAYTKAPAMTFGTRGKNAIMAPFSVTIGEDLYANNDNQLSIGKYNINNDEFFPLAFAIGNGTSDNDRSNAFNVDWDGNVEIAGDLEVTGKLTAKNFGGNYLPSGRNINNLSKYDTGWWAYARSDVDGTFPVSDTYGTIGHIQGTSENVAMQFLRSNNQGATSPVLFARYKMGSTWGAWQRYVSATTTNLTITRVNNSYMDATSVGYLQARKKGGYLSLRGNFSLSASVPTNTAETVVAQISGWNGVSGYLTVAPQNSTYGNLLVCVAADGRFTIANYSGKTCAGWYRFVLTTPCNDGYE